jgi:SAM-dependent methyltransferase
MSLYQTVMGNTWVYDVVRPLVLGGFDAYRHALGWLELRPDDVILDIGCGTGAAFDFIDHPGDYHGFDTDARALERFRAKVPRPTVHLYPRQLTAADVDRIRPTVALLLGVVHHLSDAEVASVLGVLGRCDRLRSVVTFDPVRVRGRWVNNLLASLDRGRYVRHEEQYRGLVARSPFAVRTAARLRSGNGAAHYFATCLAPAA